MEDLHAPMIGISRHRLSTDGEGVTTLVAFYGCPLRCAYCINPQCFNTEQATVMTPKELLGVLMKDNLYFLATGGGVTFGGGEPLLRYEFITEFIKIMPKEWNVTLETSLNVPLENLRQVAPYINYFIIDVKDWNNDIYLKYTEKSNIQVVSNLRWLSENGFSYKVKIRLPLIQDFNTEEDIVRSRSEIERMGFCCFDEFRYRIPK